jgi:formate C-acetyltransferase
MGHHPRVEEALHELRHKSPRSTSLPRLRLTREAWERCRELPQPLCLGQVLGHVTRHLEVPVASHDLLIGRMPEVVPDAAEEAYFQESVKLLGSALPPCCTDGGHETFDWEHLLTVGLPGLAAEVEASLARERADTGRARQVIFLEGMALALEAIREYAHRSAESARAAGLPGPAAAALAAAERAPATFHEALQLMWTVGFVYCTMVSRNPTLTFGRMDQWLYPFYRRDVDAGRLTPAQAGDLIEDFYCKNNLILGRGEHQMSGAGAWNTGWERNPTYDAPQYIVLGGERALERPDCSELTDLFLERIVPRFENPYVVVRAWLGMAAATWRLVCTRMRQNSSMMVYNDRAVIPAFERLGFSREQAREYTMHGCNWPDLPPSQILGRCTMHVLPQTLLAALKQAPRCASLDAVLAAFLAAYRERMRTETAAFRQWLAASRAQAPGPLAVDDLFLRGPIERACDKRHGGVDHVTMATTFGSFATLVDAVAALDEVVFRRGEVSLAELLAAVEADFAAREPLRQMCLQAPKFGRNDERADAIAVRLMQGMHDILDELAVEPGQEPLLICRCIETDTSHLSTGRQTGATPDGRHAGQPLSENSSPSRAVAGDGLTSVLNSLAKLPMDRCHSGALNLRLSPSAFRGRQGLEALSAVLRAYFERGGLQAQVSMVDTQTLRQAQQQPDDYHDLMVRITGYSAAFVDMTTEAQNEIIRRDEVRR